MPTYEYECTACKKRFERTQRFTDPPVTECPECGGPVRRVLFPAGIVFKGSGWYITDSRKSTSSESSATPAAANGSSGGESKGDSKGDSKGEGKGTAEATPAKSESAAPAKSDSSTSAASSTPKSSSPKSS
jgi:putative FmdB family regulatory protein